MFFFIRPPPDVRAALWHDTGGARDGGAKGLCYSVQPLWHFGWRRRHWLVMHVHIPYYYHVFPPLTWSVFFAFFLTSDEGVYVYDIMITVFLFWKNNVLEFRHWYEGVGRCIAICVCMCVYVSHAYLDVCVCITCVYVSHAYVYLYVCVYVYVCVCITCIPGCVCICITCVYVSYTNVYLHVIHTHACGYVCITCVWMYVCIIHTHTTSMYTCMWYIHMHVDVHVYVLHT